jgi:L-fuconate dehydratase
MMCGAQTWRARLRYQILGRMSQPRLFKNFLQAGALHFVQADCTRLAGISEFIAVSLLARKFHPAIVPT